jgi:hypothetical protein
MEDFSTNPVVAGQHADSNNLPSRLRNLLQVLLTDVAMDVGLVARELTLRDAMLGRLQRALDRLECAASILETVAGIMPAEPFESAYDSLGATRRETSVPIDPPEFGAAKSAWRSLESLAESWPCDYPDDAVEWLLLKE